MWKSAFSFAGELDRKGFAIGFGIAFVTLLLIGTAVLVPSYLGLLALGWSGRIDPGTFAALKGLALPLVVLITSLPYLWVLAALATKRARNIGLSPYFAAPLWLLIGPLDGFVLRPLTDARCLWPFDNMTPIGGALMALISIVLAAWPPKTKSTQIVVRKPGYPAT